MKFVGETQFNDEILAVYRTPGGGIFAIDASYVEQDIGNTYCPLDGIEFDADEAEQAFPEISS